MPSRRSSPRHETHTAQPGRPAYALREMPCPLCGEALELASGRHGLVFVCRGCHAGAATLPVLRQVAPATLVDRLWQAALHGGGRRSPRRCPSCGARFTTLRAPDARVDVCITCLWVWLGPGGLASLGSIATRRALPPALPHAGNLPLLEAPRTLGTLTARVIRDAT
jgi:ribosomal protein L37AE/L43A